MHPSQTRSLLDTMPRNTSSLPSWVRWARSIAVCVSLVPVVAGCALVDGLTPGEDDEGAGEDLVIIPGLPLPDEGQAPFCPATCSRCDGNGTCIIDRGAGESTRPVVCPPGRPCEVNCIGDTACELVLVDCTLADSCQVTCSGLDACDTGIACSGDNCTILCEGPGACEDGPLICDSPACDVTCSGERTCASGVCCNGGTCTQCLPLDGGSCACLP